VGASSSVDSSDNNAVPSNESDFGINNLDITTPKDNKHDIIVSKSNDSDSAALKINDTLYREREIMLARQKRINTIIDRVNIKLYGNKSNKTSRT